ncbi:hypothetical protein [Pseudomonas sp.]|uniref:hypothetical protein n=1 Tax=Pseudomonas sp. TaxID=306 RepID=UPI00289C4DA3|nr:hypothetical protein [Pseudomonas sp.]
MRFTSLIMQGLILLSLIGINAQTYLSRETLSEVSTSIANAQQQPVQIQPTVQDIPDYVRAKLDKVQTLEAQNAALKAIVATLNFSGKEDDQSRMDTMLPPLPTSLGPGPGIEGLPSPPPSLKLMFSPQQGPTADSSVAGAAAPKVTSSKTSSQNGQQIITPIRFQPNGSLVYLAMDGVIRVVHVNSQVYGVNGKYLGEKAGKAEFEIQGKRFVLPLITEHS